MVDHHLRQKCPRCGTEMLPLATSLYCPNGCDKGTIERKPRRIGQGFLHLCNLCGRPFKSFPDQPLICPFCGEDKDFERIYD